MAWNDILGQEFAKRILQSHLASGRVAGAYLLSGPDGVGKRRLALEITKALNCAGGDASARPCDACRPCGQINRQTHPDVHWLLPGGASDQIKIEEVRQLIGRLALRPFNAMVQVAVIDGAERLTEEAANALLKTLEEPSPQTKFFLTTAQLARCLPTIISRCQLLRCGPLPQHVVERMLVERQACDAPLATVIASLAGGSVSAALALVGRWQARGHIVDRLASDEPSVWFAQPLPEHSDDVRELLDGMSAWLRDVAVTGATGHARLLHAQHREVFRRQADRIDAGRCLELIMELAALRDSLEQFVSPKLVASLARERWLSLTDVKREA